MFDSLRNVRKKQHDSAELMGSAISKILLSPRMISALWPGAQAEALTSETTEDMFHRVFEMLVDRLPGKP